MPSAHTSNLRLVASEGVVIRPPVTRPLPCVVLLNPGAGSADEQATSERLRASFEEHGLTATVVEVEPARLDDHVRAACAGARPRLIVAAGGDGTVRAVAARLVETDHVLGVLPLGTVNVLARSLGIPLDLDEAVRNLVEGTDRMVDVAAVNDITFLNQASLGVHAELTRERERRREAHAGWPNALRWMVDSVAALGHLLGSWRHWRARVGVDGAAPVVIDLALLTVSNNPLRGVGRTRELDGGALAVYLPTATSPLALAWLVLKAALFDPENVDSLVVRTGRHVNVTVRARRMSVAIDGEIRSLATPLRFRSQPGALTVRAPPGEPA